MSKVDQLLGNPDPWPFIITLAIYFVIITAIDIAIKHFLWSGFDTD